MLQSFHKIWQNAIFECKVIEFFCATDEFSKKIDDEFEKSLFSARMGRIAAGIRVSAKKAECQLRC